MYITNNLINFGKCVNRVLGFGKAYSENFGNARQGD